MFFVQIQAQNIRDDSLTVTCYPVLNPQILSKQMRVSEGFSKFEGITGIVLEKGEHVVSVGKINGAKIQLLVLDWKKNASSSAAVQGNVFSLKEGENRIQIKTGGNAYLQYFTDTNPDDFPPITVRFPTGKYNGYFDVTKGDKNADFDRLLKNAIGPVLDMRGKYIQLAYPVDTLKKYTLSQGVELLAIYDTVVGLQRYFIGWNKEGLFPKNHILARMSFLNNMFSDRDGIGFPQRDMRRVTDPKRITKGDLCWGVCHEIGHVYQMRPQLTWGGMTEVSNNILTMYCMLALGNKSRLIVDGTYAQAREIILDKGISYMDFPGVEPNNYNQYGGTGNTDVFQRLVPFWQLYLYFKEQGYPDFYPDLMIAMRKQALNPLDKNKQYLYMLEFCRLACEVSKTDLTDFFQRWGFFYVGDMDIADYDKYEYRVFYSDVARVKSDIAKMCLPRPKKDITLMMDSEL